ncbi:mannitol dehydrogenase family protein [Celerinatantimonas sp. YJH-8]|uniref:mannitol dehydrogenase family protein n=1 Tax=Celerinatantimonas sp. YJH-8 TaxID=3228714 RepID=UPI0038CBCA02
MSPTSTNWFTNKDLFQYDRQQLKSRIVHIGFGAFHRAHQALITHEMLSQQSSDWGICEVNLMGSEQLIQNLRHQDHCYHVLEKGPQAQTCKTIGSVIESLHPAFDGHQAIIAKLAEPQVAIVSMTITEKGYCIAPATGKLDTNHPLIAHDLAHPDEPQSAIGYIVAGLRARQQAGLDGFTVLSCDNVQGNGHIVQQAVLDYTQKVYPELLEWLKQHVTFPCTMVDRIVPAMTDESLAEITAIIGQADPCAIACEPFRQWVIEDNFIKGHPDWDLAGAEFVDDVVPYEAMKLRMLNGSHSFLAYLGYLAGYPYISEAIANPDFERCIRQLMLKEQVPTLSMPDDTDLEAYAQELLDRFANPSIQHKTWQIATDGSQKLPPRFLNSIQFHLAHHSDCRLLTLAVAGWMRYVGGIDESGQPIDIRDPLADRYREIVASTDDDENRVLALLAIDSIFGQQLPTQKTFVESVISCYMMLKNDGVKETIKCY